MALDGAFDGAFAGALTPRHLPPLTPRITTVARDASLPHLGPVSSKPGPIALARSYAPEETRDRSAEP